MPLVGRSPGHTGGPHLVQFAKRCLREHIGRGVVDDGRALVRRDGLPFAGNSTVERTQLALSLLIQVGHAPSALGQAGGSGHT
jgi:hypothetical protein